MNNDKKVLKASFWYTFSNFLIKGLSFITAPIFLRILTQNEYGLYSNFCTLLSLITIVATMSLGTSLISARFDYKEEIESFVLSNLILGSLCTLIISVVLLTVDDYLANILSIDYQYIIIMALIMLFSPAYDMFMMLQRFQYKYKTVVAITLIVSILSVLVPLILIKLLEDNLWARIVGGYLPTFLVSVSIYVYFILKGKKIRFSHWKYSLAICVPYIFHMISGTVLNSSDRVMITSICGTRYNALYSAAGNIAMIANMIWASMNSAYIPWLGEMLNEEAYDKIKKYSRPYTLVFVFIVIGFMLVTPEALWIIGGRDYMEAQVVIPPIMLGYLFVFLYSLYASIEQFKKKTIGMAVMTFVATVANLMLNAVFLPKYGYVAAAYTTLVGYILLFIMHFVYVKKLGYTKAYDTKFVIGTVLVGCLIGGGILISYEHIVLRCILIVIYALVIILYGYKNKNLMKSILKK